MLSGRQLLDVLERGGAIPIRLLFRLLFLPFILFITGCNQPHPSNPILLDFKQLPQEKYVYRIMDEVEWEISDKDGHRHVFQHNQEQESEMKIEAIDSAAVRALTMSCLVTKDTLINAPDFVRQRRQGSIIGRRFGWQLQMRKNGEIIAVEGKDPKENFFFNSAYKPSQPVFPGQAISPGYEWTQNFQIDVPGGNPTVVTTQYHFIGYDKVEDFDCAVIEFKGELEYTECYKPPEKTEKFVVKKYHVQMTSEGQIFFAYREGFMVKKKNLITSTAHSKAFLKDKVESEHQTIYRDHERITLTEIHRPGGKVVRYQIQ
jgi:hypothetical protein